MQPSRLAALPRLIRNSLRRLLDLRAEVVDRPSRPIIRHPESVGYLEELRWRHDRVCLKGWVKAADLTVGFDNQSREAVVPLLERHDVRDARPDTPLRSGFEIDLHRPRGDVVLEMGFGGHDAAALRLRPPSPARMYLGRLCAVPGALRFAAHHRREVLTFLRTGDAGTAVALRDAFGFGDTATPAPLVPDGLFAPGEAIPLAIETPVVILVPVFNAPEHVARLLDRLETSVDVPHHIVLIDDGSDDSAIAPMLAEFARRHPGSVRVETLPENAGFVAAVNHGLEIARTLGGHMILLNTDTLPPNGWASRLLAPILADDNVASVTPISNTAEIASIPAQGVVTELSSDLVARIDAVAQRLGPEWRAVELPTGIGFAMAMNRRFIDDLGGFDPEFGRGYGEEVDWCQKARAMGGRHVLATSIFVGHEGGASFGSAEKAARVATAGRVLSPRYPGYDHEVRDWAETAPHALQRFALSIAWLGAVSTEPVRIFIGHVLGGGAEMALRREIDAALAEGAPGVVVLRAGGSTNWRVDIEGIGFKHACRVSHGAQFDDLLASVRERHVIYSCGVGARDPDEVPRTLLRLCQSERNRLELRLHDYFLISPSYCLLGSEGRFDGVPDNSTDPALRDWQDLWRRVISRADTLTAFSATSAALIAAAYPEATGKTHVTPHQLPEDMPTQVAIGGKAVGILGGINQAKGAEVVVGLARHLRRHASRRKIILIGELDPNYTLPPPHRITGRYTRAQISELAREHDIGVWLIPSIWPETFSFTTREALATGLPVLTFDLGAQAEAAKSAANGHVIASAPTDITALSDEFEAQFTAQVVTTSRDAP